MKNRSFTAVCALGAAMFTAATIGSAFGGSYVEYVESSRSLKQAIDSGYYVNPKTRIVADFGGGAVDRFPFEVHPRGAARESGETVALFDPEGASEPVLKAAGVKYRKVQDPARRGGARALVVGRNALARATLGVSAKDVEDGLKVMVLAQRPETWQAFGFKVQDTMEREVFPRAAAFRALPAHTFDHWRGAPDYGERPYGRVMAHSSQRGPRWTRRHVVAGLVLETPPRIGFAPLMEAGCDMAYSPLLRFSAGKGGVTFCTLDFEGRAGACPAATAAARAVFADFLSPHRAGDARAGRPPPAAAKTWTLAADFCASGRVYRAKAPAIADAACAGPALFRWSAAPPARVAADGTFTLDPAAFRAAAEAAAPDEKPMYLLNAKRAGMLLARLNTAAGAKPDPQTLRRILHLSGSALARSPPRTTPRLCWTPSGPRRASAWPSPGTSTPTSPSISRRGAGRTGVRSSPQTPMECSTSCRCIRRSPVPWSTP